MDGNNRIVHNSVVDNTVDCRPSCLQDLQNRTQMKNLLTILIAFAIISCANPKPESVPTEHIEVTDGTPMPDSIVISCKGVTRTVSYMFYRNIDLKGPDSEKPCSVLTLILNDERKEKVKRKN